MLQIFLVVSVVFLLFLNSHNITCQMCIVSSSILGAWDHKSNYDVHPSTTEIRMINESTIQSGNF